MSSCLSDGSPAVSGSHEHDGGAEARRAQLLLPPEVAGSIARPPAPEAELPVPEIEGEALDLVGILSAAQETAYVWDLASDRMEWEIGRAHV